jgi:hypothetical protein
MIFFVIVMKADLAKNNIPAWSINTISDNSLACWHKFLGTEGFRKYMRLGTYVAEQEGYVLAQYDLEKNEYLPMK